MSRRCACGALGGMLVAKYTGYVLDQLGTYTPMFLIAGTDPERVDLNSEDRR